MESNNHRIADGKYFRADLCRLPLEDSVFRGLHSLLVPLSIIVFQLSFSSRTVFTSPSLSRCGTGRRCSWPTQYIQYFELSTGGINVHIGFVVFRGKFGEFFHRAVVARFSEFSDQELEVVPKTRMDCDQDNWLQLMNEFSCRSKICLLWRLFYFWSPVMRILFSFMSDFTSFIYYLHAYHALSNEVQDFLHSIRFDRFGKI